MRFVIVDNGIVVNTAEADEPFGLSRGWVASQTAGPGDLYENGAFVRPSVAPAVPHEVTMRQARQALILAELDEAVEAAINAIPGVAGKLARAEWDKSQTVQRARPLVNQLGAALGLTPQQIDALFITAATL